MRFKKSSVTAMEMLSIYSKLFQNVNTLIEDYPDYVYSGQLISTLIGQGISPVSKYYGDISIVTWGSERGEYVSNYIGQDGAFVIKRIYTPTCEEYNITTWETCIGNVRVYDPGVKINI